MHRLAPDAHALDDHAARADERAVLHDHRRRLHGLQHPADPDPAGQVHVRADLRAGADRRPRVHHGARARPTRRCSRSSASAPRPATGTRRSGPSAGGTTRTPASSNPCFSGSRSWYSNGPDLDRLQPAHAEEQQDRLLHPRVHAPAAAVGLRHADLARGRAGRSPPRPPRRRARRSSASKLASTRARQVRWARRSRAHPRSERALVQDLHGARRTPRASATIAIRTYPSPSGPKNEPGATTPSALEQLERPRRATDGRRGPATHR